MAIGMREPSRVVPLRKRTTSAEATPHVVHREGVPAGKEVAASPMFGVAMLKIAMELKKAEPSSLEELITGVLSKMRLDEREFRAFLETNGGLLKSIAKRRSY